MKIIYKIFLSGVSILFFAVLANIIASYLNINTWYGFIEEITNNGFRVALKNQSFLSFIFMFLIYPLILGAAGYFVFNILK